MDYEMQLKDKLKARISMLALYILSEFIILCFIRVTKNGSFKVISISEEAGKLLLISIVYILTYVIITYKKMSDRIRYSVTLGMLFNSFSIATMITIVITFLKWKSRIWLLLIVLYLCMWIILYYFNRNYYLKLLDIDEIQKEGGQAGQSGVALIAVFLMVNLLNGMGEFEKNIMYIITSIVISWGWLYLGWITLQMTRKYLVEQKKEIADNFRKKI